MDCHFHRYASDPSFLIIYMGMCTGRLELSLEGRNF